MSKQKYSPRRDANAWVAYLFTLCTLIQINPTKSLCSSIVEDGFSTHSVVCGDKGRCGEENDKAAENTEPHEVRCCSDTERDGWRKSRNCSVWATSRIDGVCHVGNFLEATCICEEIGARLCTRDELLNKCTKNSGCGYDDDFIWSMTGVDLITSSPTITPVVTDVPTIAPQPTSTPTSSPTTTPAVTDVPTIASEPTSTPVSDPSLSCTEGSGKSSWEALLAFESITYQVSSTPYTLSVIASGGAAGDGTQVVSESQAYGLLSAALALLSMNENDENYERAKEKFEGYYNGWVKMARKAKPAPCQNPTYCDGGESPCLPGWKYSGDLNTIIGTGSAPDGDEDAIVGMIIALKAVENDVTKPMWYDEVLDWADRSCTQFLQDNTALSNTGSHRIVKLGSCWGGWDANGNNPSYHAPGHYRMMRDFQDSIESRTYVLPNFVNRDAWNMVIDTSYKFLETTQCEDTGLVPNWALVTEVNGNVLEKRQGSFSGSGTPQYEFGAEASRTMWRVAFDAAAYPQESSDQSASFLNPLLINMVDNFNPSPSNGWEYFGDDSLQACNPIVSNVFSSWQWNQFISAPVYSTLVSEMDNIYFAGKSFTQQDMVDAACGRVSETAGLSYYALSWQIIAQMTLNGEVSKAGKLFNGDVVPTTAPTSATGETEFCCTWDFFHCGVDNWCNESDLNCHGGCGGVWMELNSEAMSCLALHEECTTDINDCCEGSSCVGDDSYKQCLRNESNGISSNKI